MTLTKLNIDVSAEPPVVALNIWNIKKVGPHEGVGGFIVSQFRSTKSGTKSDISYVGISAKVGTVTPIFKHGE